ncbi:MAG: SoxR reducing system RseC family protein [Brevinematales bacterium]
MDERGIVVSNNNGKLKIKIVGSDPSFCEKCSIRGICNQDSGERFIVLKSKENIEEGTEVLIKSSEGFGVFLAFIVFLMPILIYIFLSYVLGKFFPYFLSYIFSFVGVILYFILLGIFQLKIFSKVKVIKDFDN